MATIKSALFETTGEIDGLIFRSRNGKIHVYSKSTKYKVPDTIYQKKKSYNWTFCSRFASAAIKIKVLKELWQKEDIRKIGAFHFIQGYNYKKMQAGSTYLDLSMVPSDNLFNINVSDPELTDNEFKITIEPLNSSGVDLITDVQVSLQAIICVEEPESRLQKSVDFIPLYSGDRNILLDEQLPFAIKIEGNEGNKLWHYPKRKVLMNLLIKNKFGEVTKFSENIYIDFQ